MKLKKVLALVLASVLLIALAACGGGESSNTQAPSSNTQAPAANTSAPEGGDETANTKSYQLTGVYTEEGEYASMMNAAFLLDLNVDGTAVLDKYNFSSYDASPADSNPTYNASYMSGTWKQVEKDGVECLQIKLACVDEAGSESSNITAYAYDVAGEYSFDLTFPVVPGMSYTRTVTMSGSESKTYATDDDFIQANKVEFVAPENIGTFVDSENNGTAYLQEDGTMLLYAGYDKFADGKWSRTADGISLTVNGEAVEVTMDGNKASFQISRSLDGTNSVDYTLVCEDISVLPAPEVAENAPYTASITMGENPTTAELLLNDDGTAAFKVFTDFTVNYEMVGNNAVILSMDDSALEGYAASIWPNVSHVWFLNEDHSMLAISNVWKVLGEDGSLNLALVAMDDTNMKVQFPSYGMERDGFTYVLSEDGTSLTVTAPGDDVLGAFGQIWAGAGSEQWTVDGNTATKAE